jgi:hypothetical protein
MESPRNVSDTVHFPHLQLMDGLMAHSGGVGVESWLEGM